MILRWPSTASPVWRVPVDKQAVLLSPQLPAYEGTDRTIPCRAVTSLYRAMLRQTVPFHLRLHLEGEVKREVVTLAGRAAMCGNYGHRWLLRYRHGRVCTILEGGSSSCLDSTWNLQ